MKKKIKVGRLMLADFETYCKARADQKIWYVFKF